MTDPDGVVTEQARPSALGRDEAVTIDGETVVYRAGEVHVLNSTASLIWRSCDGQVSIAELAGELAGAFQSDAETVTREVVEILVSLANRGLVEFCAPGVSGSPDDRPKPILEPAPVCSSCGDGPSFERVVLVDVGAALVSIGADAATIAVLREVLGDRVGTASLEPPSRTSYGVVIPDESAHGRLRPVARLHRGPDVLFRSREPERVLRALLAQVSAHDIPVGAIALEAVAVGRPGVAVLVPVPVNRVAYARAAAQCGLVVSDAPVSVVDVASGSVIVGATWTDLDVGPLSGIAPSSAAAPETPMFAWGRYRIAGIAIGGVAHLAAAVGALGPMLSAGDDSLRQLEGLEALTRAVPFVNDPNPETIVDLLH